MKRKTGRHGIAVMAAFILSAALLAGCGKGPGTGGGGRSGQEQGTVTAPDETQGKAEEPGAGAAQGEAGEQQSLFPDGEGEAGSGGEGAGGAGETADVTGGAANDTLGIFTSQTLDGTEVTQDIFADQKLNMVNIWGTFCGPCIREMPDLGELNREYEEKGVRIIGIISDVMEAGNADAQDIIDATGADYTHMVLSEDLYYNYLYQVQSIPTTLFLDSSGNLVGSYVGAKEKADWEEIIEEMLSKLPEDADEK